MASIAITGATGRLGKLFCKDPLWQEKHALTPVLRAATADSPSCESLADPGVLGRFDVLLHLAWSTVPKTAEENPDQARRIDLPLLEQLLESATSAGSHVVFLSTGAIYGNCDRESGSAETDEPKPIGQYAEGKRRAEERIEQFVRERGLSATTLRVSNVYGFPANRDRPQGVIPHLILAAQEGSVFTQWGGDSEKDYVHIDDLSRALLQIFEQRPVGVFNVASGRAVRLSELIALVEKLTGKRIRTERASDADLTWDVAKNRLNPAALIEKTGWKPRVDLEEGISRLIAEMSP